MNAQEMAAYERGVEDGKKAQYTTLLRDNALLRLGLSMLIEAHAAVNFDTEEDNAIRDRAVETARTALGGGKTDAHE